MRILPSIHSASVAKTNPATTSITRRGAVANGSVGMNTLLHSADHAMIGFMATGKRLGVWAGL